MEAVKVEQRPREMKEINLYAELPLALVVQPDIRLYQLLSQLSQDTPWGNRKMAAEKLGEMRNSAALPGLLGALPEDPFWMVRCAMIQALQMIGDPRAIPTLQEVAQRDSFQVVRSYAAKAVERLSRVSKVHA